MDGICWCLLVSFGVWRRLLVFYGVWRCGEGVWGLSQRVSECCLSTCLRFRFLWGSIWVFRPCNGTAIALYWKMSERQNSTYMAFFKPQNTKTSLYKLSKNHWVIAFLKFLGPSEENYNPQSLWITLYIIYYLTILKVLCLHDINRLHVNSCYVRCTFGSLLLTPRLYCPIRLVHEKEWVFKNFGEFSKILNH